MKTREDMCKVEGDDDELKDEYDNDVDIRYSQWSSHM